MRSIKFRVWDKKEKRLIARVLDLSFCFSGVFLVVADDGREQFIKGEDAELLQFTGLLDKNGEEIYEGDILRFINTIGDRKYYTVSWDNLNSYYRTTPNTSVPNSIWDGYFEVVGNIYENPDLIKE